MNIDKSKTDLEGDNKMVKNKIVALIIVGGMVANIGLVANAYTKTSTKSSGVKTTQNQKMARKPGGFSDVNMQADIKTKLDALVTAGTIAQSQEDKIIADYKAMETARITEMDQVKKMTEAERKTYFDSKVNDARPDVLANLVTSGTITQAQSDAIKAALPVKGNGPMGFGGPGGPRGFGGPGGREANNGGKQPMNINPAAQQANMKAQLDTLVTSATITQSQEDQVIAFFNTKDAERTAEMTKIKSMTAAERKTYMESKVKTERVDPLAELVKAGTLTQAQSDAIKNLLPGHGMGHRMLR
jgi:hypothetical protein